MTRTALLALFLAFAGPALAQPAGSHAGHGTEAGQAMAMSPGTPSAAYMDAMGRMDEAMTGMTMTGKPGVDFATMMIPHHQSAVDMAKAYLAGPEKDPVLVKLSEEIVASQEREIALLRDWLNKNR